MRKFGLLLVAALWLPGCSFFTDRLLFIEESHIGLKAKAGVDQTAPADIDFGYRRSILTLIPKANAEVKGDPKNNVSSATPPPKPGGSASTRTDPCLPQGQEQSTDPNEPLSVISSFNAIVQWFDATRVRTYFATGEAATNTACSPEAIKALVSTPKEKED